MKENDPYPVVGGDIPPPPPLPPPPPALSAADIGLRVKFADSKEHGSKTSLDHNDVEAIKAPSSGGIFDDIKNFKGTLKRVTPDMIAKPKEERRNPANAAELLAIFMDERVRNKACSYFEKNMHNSKTIYSIRNERLTLSFHFSLIECTVMKVVSMMSMNLIQTTKIGSMNDENK